MTYNVFGGTLTHWLLSSRVVILLAFATQHSVLSRSTLILHISQILQYAGRWYDQRRVQGWAWGA